MTTIAPKSKIALSFEKYKNVIFNVDVDLNFWTDFLSKSILNYQQHLEIPDKIYDAVFAVYDLDMSTSTGYLKLNSSTRAILRSKLNKERLDFFTWIRNLAILKSYNALEVFIIETIWATHYSTEKSPATSKKAADNIQYQIRQSLIKSNLSTDTKNNRHLIEFLKHNIIGYAQYLQTPINKEIITSWGNFFEMLSILRNIIAHQGTMINTDTLNDIKSKAKDIFQTYFEIVKDEFKGNHLQPKETQFSNLISIINMFGLNTVKYISGNVDFSFLNME